MFPMQWDGNLTKGGKYLGVLALLNLWIQLGMLCALSLCNLYYYPFFFFSPEQLSGTFTGWPYLLQI